MLGTFRSNFLALLNALTSGYGEDIMKEWAWKNGTDEHWPAPCDLARLVVPGTVLQKVFNFKQTRLK